MYSVFIVDDEIVVREGLRNNIDWENSQFKFAGEADDGEIALSMIQEIKPDILITDIKMPFMDGLELAQAVKKLQPWIRIIILSGHDEFDFAKKAISIGVEDYILKPFTLEEMFSCLNKVAQDLDKQKQQFSDIEKLKKELESSSALAKEKLLSDIMIGSVDLSTAIQKASDYNISLVARYYVVSVSCLYPENDDVNDLIKAKLHINSVLKNENDVVGFFISPTLFVAIFKLNVKENYVERVFNLADSFQHELSGNTKCKIITAISSLTEHFAQLPSCYQESIQILKQCRYINKNQIISSSDINKANDSQIVIQENDPIVNRLNYADESEVDQIVKEYISLLGENKETFSIIASYLLVDVLMAVTKIIEQLGGNVKTVMPEILTHSFVDKTVQNEETFIKEVKRVLNDFLKYRNEHIQGRYANTILKAKKYIDENYSNPDICLESTAKAVNFSPNHFSTIFSQSCGTTFIEYLTSVRIENAKKMLKNTDLKSIDIAYEIGFNDSHYFSYIFRKLTGLTPRDFRNQ